MSFLQYLNEYFGNSIKKNIKFLEVTELLKILKDYEEEEIKRSKQASSSMIFSDEEGEKTEKRLPTRVDKAIESTNKIENLKGIPLLTKWIDILKENGFHENSTPFLMLQKIYGPQVLDIYVRHDPEAPAFIRKGVDF